jgi:hypothetical protein
MPEDDSENSIEVAKSAVELIGAVIKVAGDHPDVKSAGSNLAKSAKTLTEFINVGLLPIAAVNFGYEKARLYFQQRFPADVEAVAGVSRQNICRSRLLRSLGRSFKDWPLPMKKID